MATSRKTILAIGGAALLLGACASDPYYNGAYGENYGYGYGYGGGPAYYDPYYTGPSVGLAWNDRDGNRWHGDRGDRGDRGRDHDWHGGNRGDRGGDRGDHDGGHDGGNGSTGQDQRG